MWVYDKYKFKVCFICVFSSGSRKSASFDDQKSPPLHDASEPRIMKLFFSFFCLLSFQTRCGFQVSDFQLIYFM
ncbi:unnamed protein product [Brassica oleracea var. botrytis]